MIALLLASALVGPPLPAQVADRQAEHLLWITGSVSADLLTTSWGLRRCLSCYESNPLGADAEARIALKLGMASAVAFGTWKLERADHHGWAKVLRWTYVGVTAGLVANNIVHISRRK